MDSHYLSQLIYSYTSHILQETVYSVKTMNRTLHIYSLYKKWNQLKFPREGLHIKLLFAVYHLSLKLYDYILYLMSLEWGMNSLVLL